MTEEIKQNTETQAAPQESPAPEVSSPVETPVVENNEPQVSAPEQEQPEKVVTELTHLEHSEDPIEDGSLQEIMENQEAASQPEPSPEPEVKEETVSSEVTPPAAPEVAKTEEQPVEKSEEELYLDDILVNGTEEQKRILAAIKTFEAGLVPRASIDPAQGVKIQYEFLKHMLWALGKEYKIFRGCWNVLLVYFQVHHGKPTVSNYTALSEFSTNRFTQAWTKGQETNAAYRNLITLLRATRNKATRKHDIKTIALNNIAPSVLTETMINNLKQFYEA